MARSLYPCAWARRHRRRWSLSRTVKPPLRVSVRGDCAGGGVIHAPGVPGGTTIGKHLDQQERAPWCRSVVTAYWPCSATTSRNARSGHLPAHGCRGTPKAWVTGPSCSVGGAWRSRTLTWGPNSDAAVTARSTRGRGGVVVPWDRQHPAGRGVGGGGRSGSGPLRVTCS